MASANLISPDEANLVRFLLSAKNAPRQIKRGLQRLCGHLEKGRRLVEGEEHRQLIRGLLWDADEIVRMYAFKALGLLRKAEDAEPIIARLRQEPDVETQTWGMAALVGVAGDRDIDQVFRDTGLDSSLPLLLAGLLYANPNWVQKNHRPVHVPENSDPITLKWAVLLVAYRKAPANLFSPRHDNRVLMGELNTHDAREVAEHSTWALYEHPEFGVTDYTVKLDEVPKLPANVKKWAFRLLMTDPDQSGLDCDALGQFRKDADVEAREGLALGLNGYSRPGVEQVVLDWYDGEREDPVKEILLEHMAFASNNGEYAGIVVDAFANSAPGSSSRGRLLAASQGCPAYGLMKRRLAIEAMTEAGMNRELLGGDFVVGNQIKAGGSMSGNIAGGDQTGQNLVAGDMIASAHAAVQNLGSDQPDQRNLLESVLTLLDREKGFLVGAPEAVASAVSAITTKPTPQNKMTLIGTLKALSTGTALATGVVEHIDKLVHAVTTLF